MSKPKISIIIPIYNTEKYLNRCIKSIKAQTEQDFECLLIDDGSIDASGLLCDSACAADIRFKVFHIKNGGVSRARNIGLDQAAGEWTTFCDSDDWMEPNRLELALAAAKRERQNFIWSPMRIWQDGTMKKLWYFGIEGEYRAGDGVVLSSGKYDIGHVIDKLYRTSLLDGIRFQEEVQMAEDLIFNIEVFYRNGRIYNDGLPTYNYIRRPGSLSRANKGRIRREKLLVAFNRLQQKLDNVDTFNKDLPIVKAFVENVIHV